VTEGCTPTASMSGYGTKQTWRDVGLESVMRSKADIDRCLADAAFSRFPCKA
jgi:hypothetical protein